MLILNLAYFKPGSARGFNKPIAALQFAAYLLFFVGSVASER